MHARRTSKKCCCNVITMTTTTMAIIIILIKMHANFELFANTVISYRYLQWKTMLLHLHISTTNNEP